MLDAVIAAAVQIEVTSLDPEANVARVASVLDNLARRGEQVHLAVLPELAVHGFPVGRNHPEFKRLSVEYIRKAAKVPGPLTESLGELARKHNTYIVCGMTELHHTVPYGLYNSAVLVGPQGQLVGLHRKVQVTSGEKQVFFAGNAIDVYPTELGTLAVMVCSDATFPEVPRVAALKGTEILCLPFAANVSWTRDPGVFRRLVSVRAFENNIFIVASNRVGKQGRQTYLGQSCICSPWGDFLANSDADHEDVVRATLFREELEAARAHYVRFRDRRPELYGKLCEPV